MKMEIKFRAWDEHLELMINPYCELKDGNFWGEDCTNTGYSVKHNHVMQYTGLKDKNGKEIYEGDIVQYKESEQEKELEFYITKELVQYHIGSFGFQGWNIDSKLNLKNKNIHHPAHFATRDIYYVKFDIEVIGNIHENPELL